MGCSPDSEAVKPTPATTDVTRRDGGHEGALRGPGGSQFRRLNPSAPFDPPGDEAVPLGLCRGEHPAGPGAVADLINLAAGHLGEPEVERVEHPPGLLFARGDGHRRAVELI